MTKPIPQPVKDYIAAAPVCRIATVREDGSAHVIPVCPVFDGETFFIDIGENDVTARALRRDPRITVLIDDYFDDWTKLRKVILYCTARPATPAEGDAAWDLIAQSSRSTPRSIGRPASPWPSRSIVGARPASSRRTTLSRNRHALSSGSSSPPPPRRSPSLPRTAAAPPRSMMP